MKKTLGIIGVLSAGLVSFAYGANAQNLILETPKKILTSSYYNDVYEYKVNQYIYDGDIKFDKNLDVYSQTDKKFSNDQINKLLDKLSLNGVNIGNFSDKIFTNISFKEDKKNGYRVNIDLERGSIYINRNNSYRIYDYTNEIKPMLGEKETLKIAKDFLKKYNINVSKYGTPYMEKENYELMMLSSIRYNPNATLTVIYPEMINGKEVYEQYGSRSGIRITIDNNTKKVNSVNIRLTKTTKNDKYKIDMTQEEIKKQLKEYTRNQYIPEGENTKVTYNKIDLKKPKLVYAKHYKYNGSESNVYLVPSLYFEIENTDMYSYPKQIVVPLVKDFQKNNKAEPIVYNKK